MSSEQRAVSRNSSVVIPSGARNPLRSTSRARACEGSSHKLALRSLVAALLGMTLIFLGGGCSKTIAPVKAPTKLTVKSVRVDAAPKLDADGNDAVWKNAPLSKIPTKDGATVELRSVYTDKDIYFLAQWPDKTPQTGVLWWEFDGKKWTRNYDRDDKISFFWNINNSIPGFDKNGCRAICHSDSNGATMNMTVSRSLNLKGDFPAVKWMADAWKWAPGVMNNKNSVDDGLYAAPKEIRTRPELADSTALSLVFDGGDAGTKQWFTRNPNAAGESDKEKDIAYPAYMPKPGFDLTKNPFPNMRDMIQITDYSIFKAGDKLPLMVYFDLTNVKNRQDFPGGKPSGSRMDIFGKGKWKNGGYTLEFGRKLNTGHDDDVQFKPKPGQAVATNVFGLAIFNDTRFNHNVSDGVTLILEP